MGFCYWPKKMGPARRLSPSLAVWTILTFVQRALQRNSHICHQNGFDIVPKGGERVGLWMKVGADDDRWPGHHHVMLF